MKKIFSILLVAVLAFGMASCKSKEEKAVDEIVTLCDKIVDAAEDGDYNEVLSLSADMMKLGSEIDKKEKSGELKFTDEQMERVQKAVNKVERLGYDF